MTAPPGWQPDPRLLALARTVQARIGAPAGAAVADDTGRTFAAPALTIAGCDFGALLLACAQAVAAGAREVVAAVMIGSTDPSATDLAAVAELVGSAEVTVGVLDRDGRVRHVHVLSPA